MTLYELYTKLEEMIDDPEVDSDMAVGYEDSEFGFDEVTRVENDGYRILLLNL